MSTSCFLNQFNVRLTSSSSFLLTCPSFLGHRFLRLFIPLVPLLFSFNSVIIGKNDILTSWNSHEIQTGGTNTTDVLEFVTL